MRRMRGEIDSPEGRTWLRTAQSGATATRMLEETRDALELAIVSGAPPELVDRLALVAGVSSALVDLSSDSPAITALTSSTSERARIALDAWRTWQSGLLPRTG